jgi:hypothetical protein
MPEETEKELQYKWDGKQQEMELESGREHTPLAKIKCLDLSW